MGDNTDNRLFLLSCEVENIGSRKVENIVSRKEDKKKALSVLSAIDIIFFHKGVFLIGLFCVGFCSHPIYQI